MALHTDLPIYRTGVQLLALAVKAQRCADEDLCRLGWQRRKTMSQSERQIAGAQRRTLRTMRQRLLQMAEAWDGVDEFNRTQLTELADQAEKVAGEMVADDEVS